MGLSLVSVVDYGDHADRIFRACSKCYECSRRIAFGLGAHAATYEVDKHIERARVRKDLVPALCVLSEDPECSSTVLCGLAQVLVPFRRMGSAIGD